MRRYTRSRVFPSSPRLLTMLRYLEALSITLFPSFHYTSLTCFPSPCSRHYPAADYYESSVTVGLASRRQSRVPFHRERIDRLRCPIHALTLAYCKMFTSVLPPVPARWLPVGRLCR